MDFIKNTINLNGDNIIIFFQKYVSASESEINKITSQNNDIDDKTKIKILIRNTFIFDTYLNCIKLMMLTTNSNTIFWEKADNILSSHNINFNTNKNLLETIMKLIQTTDDIYEKIFLVKMGKSMEKYGIACKNTEKIIKIITQLEHTETNIYNVIERPIKIHVDRNKIDARSESIMSSVYPDKNSQVKINNKTYYYLIKKIKNNEIRKNIEYQYNKKHIDILPLVGKLLLLRNLYAKTLGYQNYYDFCGQKTADETEELQNLISDLNFKLDDSFSKIISELKNIAKKKKLSFNDIIEIIDTLKPDIKLTPIEVLQFVMITIQKKMGIEFKKSSSMVQINSFSNCIEIYDRNKILKGYLYVDIKKRSSKNISQTTVLKLNSQYEHNLPTVYLMASYNELEKEICSYSELVNMFKEFGNILINIFAYTPNSIIEVDLETYNFVPYIMEFLAYDEFVLDIVCRKYGDGLNKVKKSLKIIRKLELIINIKLKCANALFDNIIHTSENLFNEIKSSSNENIGRILIKLNYKILNDIFKKHLDIIDIPENYVMPSMINNITNGNQGFIYGTILSMILAYNAYLLIGTNNFLIDLMENKKYSYRKTILDFVSQLKHDYFNEFLSRCLNIELKKVNAYDDTSCSDNV